MNNEETQNETVETLLGTKLSKDGQIETNWGEIAEKLKVPEVIEKFDDMNLNPNLLRGIYTYGFKSPSSIQMRGIMAVSTSRHVIAQAQSGTGKTATFVVGSLNRVDLNIRKCQVLVLAPTRELANQIFEVYLQIGLHMKKDGLDVMVCVGGTSVDEDQKRLEKGVQVIVGTPGRVCHLIKSKNLELDKLRSFILDEADEMLSRGFQEQIYDILSSMTTEPQICLFSATLEQETLEIADKFMQEPIMILVKKEEVTLEGIQQYYIPLKNEWKYEILCDIYEGVEINQCIIYCNTKRRVEWLANTMIKDDHSVSQMHGDMDDSIRKKIMSDFRKGNSRVLITTDLNSRGIDVQGVSLVINFDLPKQKETYIHRIGRSGRFGRKGTAINFVVSDDGEDSGDVTMMKEIEQYYSTEIVELSPDALGAEEKE